MLGNFKLFAVVKAIVDECQRMTLSFGMVVSVLDVACGQGHCVVEFTTCGEGKVLWRPSEMRAEIDAPRCPAGQRTFAGEHAYALQLPNSYFYSKHRSVTNGREFVIAAKISLLGVSLCLSADRASAYALNPT